MRGYRQFGLLLAMGLALAMLTSACSDDGKSSQMCQPGTASACTCPGNLTSTMTCLLDGSGWGSCNCPTPDVADDITGPDVPDTGQGCASGAIRDCTCAGGGSGSQTCLPDGSGWGDCTCAPPDVTEDIGELPPDCVGAASIAQVRAAAPANDGEEAVVDMLLCDVLVTYAYSSGVFIQEGSTGPAIRVFQNNWTPDVAVGDLIRIRATKLLNYGGNFEITEWDPIVVTSSGNPVVPQVLTSAPTGDYFDELVEITGATATAIDGRNVDISYGSATGVTLRVKDSSGFCMGSTFGIRAIVTWWEDAFRIESFSSGDFFDLDTSMCGGSGRAPQAGELLVNEFMAVVPLELAGDANCDGSRSSSEDEFIEVVNLSADELSLAGVTISDSESVRHTFGLGQSLPAGKVIVVYGGGDLDCTSWPSDVAVVTASAGRLSLNDSGDGFTLADASATVLLTYTYGDLSEMRGSQTLNPDLNNTAAASTAVDGYVLHSVADTVDSSNYSPGTKIDGSPF